MSSKIIPQKIEEKLKYFQINKTEFVTSRLPYKKNSKGSPSDYNEKTRQ